MQQDGNTPYDAQQRAGGTGFVPTSTPSISIAADDATLANLPSPDLHSSEQLLLPMASEAPSTFPSARTVPSTTRHVVLQEEQVLINLYTGAKTPLNKAKKDVLVSLCLLVGGGEESNYSSQTKSQLLDYIETFVG